MTDDGCNDYGCNSSSNNTSPGSGSGDLEDKKDKSDPLSSVVQDDDPQGDTVICRGIQSMGYCEDENGIYMWNNGEVIYILFSDLAKLPPEVQAKILSKLFDFKLAAYDAQTASSQFGKDLAGGIFAGIFLMITVAVTPAGCFVSITNAGVTCAAPLIGDIVLFGATAFEFIKMFSDLIALDSAINDGNTAWNSIHSLYPPPSP